MNPQSTAVADADLLTASRRAWRALETVHVVGYFAPETTEEYVALGLHPRLAYFASRAAAMGAVGPGVSTATFFVFAPWLHQAILPAAWDLTSPADVVAARRRGIARALTRILGAPDLGEALALARTACEGLTPEGRPLYAAHADLDWPEDELLALWHAATLLREHRGDGHIGVLTTRGIDAVEATVLDGTWSGKTAFLTSTRGWSEEEYAAAAQRLVERGWLDEDGALTETGQSQRDEIELLTDEAGLAGWRHLGLDGTLRLAELARPLAVAVTGSGLFPEDLTASLSRS